MLARAGKIRGMQGVTKAQDKVFETMVAADEKFDAGMAKTFGNKPDTKGFEAVRAAYKDAGRIPVPANIGAYIDDSKRMGLDIQEAFERNRLAAMHVEYWVANHADQFAQAWVNGWKPQNAK